MAVGKLDAVADVNEEVEVELETPVEELSLRETIEASIASAEEADAGEGQVKSETEGAKQEAKQGLERDDTGKFQPKEDAKPVVEVEKPVIEEAPAAIKAPTSWRPAAREKFAKLELDVQQEIIKREQEMSRGFNEVTDIRKFRDHFLGSVNQYANVINAEGGKPLETVDNLLKTANVLYSGSQLQKAQTVAAIIKNFGIDITALDEALVAGGSGAAQHTQAPDMQQQIQQQIQQALAPLLRGQRDAEERTSQDAATELEAFMADPKNEFAADVAETMADLLEVSANRGQKMNLSTAYSRAILAHNDIADVVARRETQARAASASVKAVAAKKKAVSISGAPVKSLPSEDGSLRQDILNAIDANSA